MRIDAHLHLWNPLQFTYPWLSGPLQRRFGPEDVPRELGGIDAMVFVEANCLPGQAQAEAEWAASAAAAGLPVAGIVAFAPVDEGTRVSGELDRRRRIELVRGIRRNLQGEPAEFFDSPDLVAGLREVALRGLTFDACVTWRQLPALIRLLDRAPELTVVLDHLAGVSEIRVPSGPPG